MKRKFTRNNFKSWLESLDPHQTIGFTRADRSCPIAAFVKSYGHPFASVGLYISWGTSYFHFTSFEAPKWADKFITKVDSLGFHYPVTAKECLDILKEV